MSVKVQTPTQAQIDELRNLFNQKYEQSPPAVPFHAVDINRIRNDGLWCQRFLEMYDLDMQLSFEKLWETCIWRQSYGANDLNESKLRQDYLNDGALFVRNVDVDGCPLLVFKTKLHSKSKDLSELIRLVIYWVERTQREKYLVQLTLFFDMSGTGLSQLDVDFIKNIVDTFRQYYPNTLNYILVYDLAWVLNAAFKVVKSILPPKALQILRIISKKDINTYINKDNCLISWGGNDSYEYRFTPENPQVTAPTKPSTGNGVAPTQASMTNGNINGNENDESISSLDKKVHFANNSPTRIDMMEYKDILTPIENEMLRLEPSGSVPFKRNGSNESILTLSSIAKIPITFKIQTTSPEKFRVKPRCGVLAPNEKINITIILKAEHTLSENNKDKFLVMSMPSDSSNYDTAEIIELWKFKPQNSPDVEQHRLFCQYVNEMEQKKFEPPSPLSPPSSHQPPPKLQKSISQGLNTSPIVMTPIMAAVEKPIVDNQFREEAKELRLQLEFAQKLQYFTLAAIIVIGAALLYLISMPRVFCK